MNPSKPLVSIGIPVYNGASFIRKRLDSILTQTLTDFEIIISDNASTDSTEEICKEYAKKDRRVRYYRQTENLGSWKNFGFVLENADADFFVFAAVDDIILPKFLEKTIKVLQSDEKVVCSASKIKMFGKMTDYFDAKINEKGISKKIKDYKKIFSRMSTYPANGDYNNRVNTYFKNARHNQIFYGVYRTEQLKKSFVKESFLWNDGATILNILKFGELHVIDECLMEVYDGGMSRKGMIGVSKQMNRGLYVIFPYLRFTLWCASNLKSRIVLKNFGFFVNANIYGIFSILIDIIRRARAT